MMEGVKSFYFSLTNENYSLVVSLLEKYLLISRKKYMEYSNSEDILL